MSSDEQDGDITIVSPYHSEYAASEPGFLPQRIKTDRTTRLSEAERLHRNAIEHLNADPIAYLQTPQQKRHIFKKSLFVSSKDDISMSTSADTIKEINRRSYDWGANTFNSLIAWINHRWNKNPD